MAFCPKCGKKVADGSRFCPGCGHAVGAQFAQSSTYQQSLNALQQLSSKVKINAIIWIVVASLQVIIGAYNIIVGCALIADYDEGMVNIITGIFVLIVAVMNYISASRDNKYSKEILNKPVVIFSKYSPIGAYIGNMIYNLLFGGIIGVAGSIYELYIRNFVISNKNLFDNIEFQYYQYLKNCQE